MGREWDKVALRGSFNRICGLRGIYLGVKKFSRFCPQLGNRGKRYNGKGISFGKRFNNYNQNITFIRGHIFRVLIGREVQRKWGIDNPKKTSRKQMRVDLRNANGRFSKKRQFSSREK